jgi:hypothetical protein
MYNFSPLHFLAVSGSNLPEKPNIAQIVLGFARMGGCFPENGRLFIRYG